MTSSNFTPCPKSGSGVHNWLMKAAWQRKRAGITEEVALESITACMTRNPNPDNEVETAIQQVYHGSHVRKEPQFPPRDWNHIRQVLKEGMTLEKLSSASPDQLPDACAETVLRALFSGNPLLCVGEANNRAVVKSLEEWLLLGVLARMQFIVPSPMLGLTGMTAGPDPHTSPRALSNVGPRKWLVVECDFGQEDLARTGAASTFDLCSAVLAYLAYRYRPLVAVVHSGNRSLHGWFAVGPQETERSLWLFMAQAVICGADPKTWTKNQFVRMPGGTRDSAIAQRVVYFNRGRAEKWA